MIDVADYNIFRVVIKNTYNAWNELVFHKGQVIHCVGDSKVIWFARPIGSDAIPRMILKTDCRELTKEEREAL